VILVSIALVYTDDSDDEDTEMEDLIACYSGLQACMGSILKYQSPDPNEITALISKAGIANVCKDITSTSGCTENVVKDNNCPSAILDVYKKARSAISFICLDKIDDIQLHWECYFGAKMDPNQEECKKYPESMAQCETEDLIKCVDTASKASPLCKPGASELIAEILEKFVSIMPQCTDLNNLQRMLLNYLKK